MSFLGIIPARYASTRLHAKPLEMIDGKTMIQRTYESAARCSKLDDLLVATDHREIYDEVKSFKGNVVMTSKDHQSGTDRCYEAYDLFGKKHSFVINIQGDEPLVPAQMIDSIIGLFDADNVKIATLASKIKDSNTLQDPNKVKVVLNHKNEALYFSRPTIPFQKSTHKDEWMNHHDYYKHVGLYGYASTTLKDLVALPKSKLESIESLEQLRWLENGFKIKVGITDLESPSVDTLEDLEKMRSKFK